METKYGEYTITFDERRELWVVDLGDRGIRENASLFKLKEAIDRAGTKKKKAIKIQVLFMHWNGSRFDGDWFVTSKAERNNYWYVGPDKQRGKENIRRFRAYTPANIEISNQIEEIQKQIEQLQGKSSQLAESLAPFPGLPEDDD